MHKPLFNPMLTMGAAGLTASNLELRLVSFEDH